MFVAKKEAYGDKAKPERYDANAARWAIRFLTGIPTMPYELHTDTEHATLRLIYTGAVTDDDLVQATRAGAERINETGMRRALADLSAIERIDATEWRIFELPQTVYPDAGLSQQLRIAVLVPRNEKVIELARFYELVCRNRGWQARTFFERDDAVSWLTGVEP